MKPIFAESQNHMDDFCYLALIVSIWLIIAALMYFVVRYVIFL